MTFLTKLCNILIIVQVLFYYIWVGNIGPCSMTCTIRYRWARLQIMVDSILTDFINRGVYNKTRASHSAKNISANIKTLAKELGYSKR